MRVLVACEYSGRVRDAFIARGHDAVSCDLLPTDADGPHVQGDARDLLQDGWDLLVAHPPCTFLANSGVRHLHTNAKRWPELFDAAALFRAFLNAPVPRIAVENPIMHKYGRELIGGGRADQAIQPWMFGHPETKATCLWLKGLPPLKPTKDVKAEMEALPDAERHRIHHLPPSKDRWKLRSTTFQGIADAMAEQWGDLA